MYFVHSPKLALVGSWSWAAPAADRAAALGAEVVAVELDEQAEVAVADLDGFDVAAVFGADRAQPCAAVLGRAADLLAPALCRGALVVLCESPALDDDGRRFVDSLAERSGLEAGVEFDVVAAAGDEVVWSTSDEAAETVLYLMATLRAAAPGSAAAPVPAPARRG